MKKVGVALGSGGLRGMAHLGVLKGLEEQGIHIDFVAGCSIGSLIGALYCSGQSTEQLIKLANQIKKRHVLDFAVLKNGIFSGEKILELTALLTRRCDFCDLSIPLQVVATDLQRGKSVVLKEGSVSKAVRASASVPGVFVPYEYNGMMLVDGALLNPTPVDVCRAMGADIVIGVDLSCSATDFPLKNMFDIIIKSLDIMENELTKNRMAGAGTIMVKPSVAHIPPSSFAYIEESIAIGYRSIIDKIPELRQMM